MIKCDNGDCYIEGQGNVVFAEMVSLIRSFTHMLRENYEGDDPDKFIRDTSGIERGGNTWRKQRRVSESLVSLKGSRH